MTTQTLRRAGHAGATHDMSDTMQAVVVAGPADYRLEQVPVPTPEPGELSSRSGPSGSPSDLKCYHDAPKSGATASGPPRHRNVIPGHELVGTIVHIDDQSRQRWGVDIGDRVVSDRSCHAGTAGSARYAPQQCSYPGRRSPSSGRASSGRWAARRGSRCGMSGTA